MPPYLKDDPEAYRAARTRVTKGSRLRRLQRERDGAVFDVDMVDARASVEAVRAALRARPGSSTSELARIAGVAKTTTERLRKGYKPGMKVSRKTERLILALRDDPDTRAFTPGQRISNRRSKQIIHSLQAQGFTCAHLTYIVKNNTGKPGSFIRAVSSHPIKPMHKEKHDLIVWLADAIGDQVGPSLILRRKRLRQGIYPTKHYDVNGDLIPSSLTPRMKAFYESV